MRDAESPIDDVIPCDHNLIKQGEFKSCPGPTSLASTEDDRRSGDMSRYLPHGVVGAVVLVLACQTLGAPAPAHGQAAAADAKAAALKERDRLREETQKLRAAGKTAEAIAAAEAMLAIERKVLREGSCRSSPTRWAGWPSSSVEREDFAAAKAARREALDILRKRLGESDWRVVDARRALEDVERLAGMDRDQRARLAEAERLNRTVEDLYGAGKYAEAVPAARQALAIRKAVLGERHPDTATSLNNLAELLESQGDYAAAKPLYEQALAIRKAALGERHPDTANSLNNLALLLKAQGDYAAAKPLYEQALAIRKAVLGAPPPPPSLNNLAELLKRRGTTPPPSPSSSRPWRSQGPGRTLTPPSLNNLASCSAGGLRRRQAPLRAGPGDPQGGAGRAPPRHRPQPEQPGGAARRRRGTTPPPSPSTSRPWRSARRCWASATPTPPPA